MIIGIDGRMYGAKNASGIGQYIEKLTEQLFQIDTKNHYVLFLREPVFSEFVEPNSRVKKVKVTPRWYSYAEQFVLPFELVKEKIDLIHYPHFNSPILFFKKSVCTIHDLTPFYFSGHKMKSKLRKFAHRFVFSHTIKRAEKILTVSDYTKNEIIKQFKVKNDKLETTYLGVDDRFNNEPNYGIINETLGKYGIVKPFIFFVGAWRNHKNFEGLISAFEILKKKYRIPHKLVLGGQEDPHYLKIREKIQGSPEVADIIAPGFIADEDLPAIYQAADVFVLPSFLEGFGLIAIEAQTCSCPVVSSDTGALPEILGDSAIYFNPKNSQDMAEKIYRVINDQELKQKLIARGLENIKRFSWRICAEKTIKIYEDANQEK
jgi:glycosyltransferase involved in cell wall biosynthesis